MVMTKGYYPIQPSRYHEGGNLSYAHQQVIASRQAELLNRHIRYLASHSPYYRSLFSALKVKPGDITGLDNLALLPFTSKTDPEQHHEDFIAVSRNRLVDLCLTSGTTGRPIAMFQTSGDLERLAYNVMSYRPDRDNRSQSFRKDFV